jgi:mRNA interferase RelE/StbE
MRILTALTRLGDDPSREDADVKKLAGVENLFRLRVGNWRVAYQIDGGQLIILVVRIGNRREVYRNL